MTKNQVLAATYLAEKDIQKQVTDTDNGKVENWVMWRSLNAWAYVKINNSHRVSLTFREGVVRQIDVEPEKPGVGARYRPALQVSPSQSSGRRTR